MFNLHLENFICFPVSADAFDIYPKQLIDQKSILIAESAAYESYSIQVDHE